MTGEHGGWRLFVAVDVADSAREALDAACRPLRRSAPDLRWTDPVQWHVTLAFLGWVPVERMPVVEVAVAGAAAAASPFELRLDGEAGTFGGRVLWAGLAVSDDLSALADDVQRRLRGAGFELEERAFHAHLTLARAPRRTRVRRGLIAPWRGPEPSWAVDRVALMRSVPSGGGARYEVCRSWGLASGGHAVEDT